MTEAQSDVTAVKGKTDNYRTAVENIVLSRNVNTITATSANLGFRTGEAPENKTTTDLDANGKRNRKFLQAPCIFGNRRPGTD